MYICHILCISAVAEIKNIAMIFMRKCRDFSASQLLPVTGITSLHSEYYTNQSMASIAHQMKWNKTTSSTNSNA